MKALLKKIFRPLKGPVVSIARRLLSATGVESQLASIHDKLSAMGVESQLASIRDTLNATTDAANRLSAVVDRAETLQHGLSRAARFEPLIAPTLHLLRAIRMNRWGHPLAKSLENHYGACADLFLRYADHIDNSWHRRFGDDDWTLAYVKSAGIYVPGGEAEPLADSKSHPLLALLDDPDCGVFLVLGQSNAANHGSVRHQSKSEVYTLNFMDMTCYHANDPLPGASGDGGSIWSRLGDRLIEEGVYRRVLFVPIAFGGTFVRDWVADGSMTRRLDLCLSRLYRATGGILPLSGVIWQQGEAEANHTNMSSEEYTEYVRQLIAGLREKLVLAPIFIATTTLCASNSPPFENASSIRSAQIGMAMPELGVLPGPDLDAVGIDERYDACHLSGAGLDHSAQLWFETIRDVRPLLLKPRITLTALSANEESA